VAPRVGFGLLAPLFDRGELTDHLLATFGLAYAGFFPTDAARPGSGTPQALSTPFALELRLGLGAAPRYRSALAVRAWLEPTAVLAAGPRRLALETGAALEARLAPGRGTDGGRREGIVIVRAQIARHTLAFAPPGPAVEALLSLGVELR
jgi:hypothetical protein